MSETGGAVMKILLGLLLVVGMSGCGTGTQPAGTRAESGSSQGQVGRVGWTLKISDDPDFPALKEIAVATHLVGRPMGRTFQLVTQQAQLK